MKRSVALLLLLVLLLALPGCAAQPPQEVEAPEEPLSTSTPQGSEAVSALWEQLAGVWLYEGDGTYFVHVYEENGTPVYSTGLLYSDYVFRAQPTALLEQGDGQFEVTLLFENSAPGEGERETGQSAKTLSVDTRGIGQGQLRLTNLFDLAAVEIHSFTYGGKTMDEAIEAITEDEFLLEDAWAILRGFWVVNVDGSRYFASFLGEDGAYTFGAGLLETEHSIVGQVSSFLAGADHQSCTLGILFPAVPANELSDGYEAFFSTVVVDFSKAADGFLTMNNIALDGTTATFTYVGDRMEAIDFDALP